MLHLLRSNKLSPLWTLVRLYLGVQWIQAGWHKIGGFDASGFIKGAIGKAAGDHPSVQGWYAAFLDKFALPNIGLFNFLIPWGEFLVGLGLILGTFTTAALYAGAFMNLNFMLAGTTSTNPILYTLAIILLVMGPSTYRYGIDYYLLPKMKKMTANLKQEDKKVQVNT